MGNAINVTIKINTRQTLPLLGLSRKKKITQQEHVISGPRPKNYSFS